MAAERRAVETSPSPVLHVPDEITYKGYRIEPASYVVGHGNWSPRAVVSVKSADGGWQATPLYSPSSTKFPTRVEADRSALDVATAWIDAALQRLRQRGE